MGIRITDENRKWWVLVAMTGTLSMIMLDVTVVGVALPSIQQDLNLTQTELQWIINAYLLTLAAFVAVAGRLSDMFNRVGVFMLGIVIFIAGSVLTGLAESEAWIISSRALQGVGAALMIPPSMTLVINAFKREERGVAMGIYAGISMIFLALGPLVGGAFTEWDWRAVFFLNVPLGVLTILLTLYARPAGKVEGGQKFDWLGFATLVPGLVALVLALTEGQSWGWTSPQTIGLLVAALVLLVAFVFIEPRVRQPLIELRLFKQRNFTGDNIVLFFVQFALVGLTVFGPIYVQDLLGFSPIEAGLSLLPLTIPLLIIAPIGGRIYDRIGARAPASVGSLIVAFGLIWNAAWLSQLDYALLVPGYVAIGIGVGLVMSPCNTDGMQAAQREFRGQASGVIQTMRQIGGTVGLAIMGAVVSIVERDRITGLLESLGLSKERADELERFLSQTAQQQQTSADALSSSDPGRVAETVRDALVDGIAGAYFVGGGVMILAGVTAFLMLKRLSKPSDEDADDDHPHAPVPPHDPIHYVQQGSFTSPQEEASVGPR